ncbi:ribonuclease J [Actinobaculum suis]|uniref:Ribonuclease J n=1 Tax=Actinobaculum suis TaxID=1657 RepID=A0A0K9EV24_9ACTO|nr:ribonuclease J [Actinobaculum suis]KMY24014.1 ribonuclease [Actinobaculum suis]MDY5153911.1 ribonuclease J [Actinobaculum suis]OCA96286.1 RNase J family beta-CASP ribonuclease [Actinobaculum suis]SDE00993.1 ribonuclease J [Actinobaculum suis]VDG76778.1 RNA-metabolising metallo-beta-lactamase [Actinobaculum suis]
MNKDSKGVPPAQDAVRIVPLGGLGEVGRNCNIIEYKGKLVVADCGVLFPEETQPGVDLILPNLDYLEDRLDDIVAIVLTHGHEDHIGAVPYLLKMREDIPVVGSQLTIAFVEAKLQEHRIRARTQIVAEGDVLEIAGMEFEFIAVNHSIPDALAMFVRTPEGNILITGDFKMDQLPVDGRLTDLRAFAAAGEEGVDLYMVDSTNAEVPGFVHSEAEIAPVIDRVIENAQGQVVVASFASHVHRVQQVLNAAANHGRKVAFVGRSMVRNMGIAEELGYLDIPENTVIDVRNMDSVAPNKRIYMSTGSQGEPMAVLARLANRSHNRISIGEGDTVLLASSLIPGNENAVFRVINGLIKLGAQVIHQGNERVHVSGHAAQGELLYTYNILQPAYAMPVHGEVRHLVANGKIAVETGVPPENVILAENGSVIDMLDGECKLVGSVPFQNIYVDGGSIGTLTESELKDRQVLSSEGFIVVFAVVDPNEKSIVTGPHIQARAMAEEDAVFDDIQDDVQQALEEALDKGMDAYGMQQAMRRVIGRWASRKLRRAPMIIPTVVEI